MQINRWEMKIDIHHKFPWVKWKRWVLLNARVINNAPASMSADSEPQKWEAEGGREAKSL